MDGDRGHALLADTDQWARCRHEQTVLLDGGGVQLDWFDPDRPEPDHPCAPVTPSETGPIEPAGLAFDAACTAYLCRPATGSVVAIPATAAYRAAADDGPCTSRFDGPVAAAVDADQRLYVAERDAGRVAVLDLPSRRVLRRVSVRTGRHPDRRPIDVAATPCGGVLVLVERPIGIVIVAGRRGPREGPTLSPPTGVPSPLALARLTVTPESRALVLWRAADGEGVVAGGGGEVVTRGLWGAGDIDTTADGTLVVGLVTPPLLRRFRPVDGGWLELEPLAATGFDGGAVSVAPGGRIAFTTARGFGWSGGARARRRASGRVLTYRLDSGAYRTRWGRMFLDACIPPGTRVEARFMTSDDDEVIDSVPPRPAERATMVVRRPELTPPLPSLGALDSAGAAAPLYRRRTGRELPWAQIAADDGFETYEAPVSAPRGRYLWVVLELRGTARVSPRIRELRVERPGHRLLDQLPRSWSRDEDAAAFLHRFLAPAEGMVHELDSQAAHRELLVDPRVAPQEVLPWLAGFAGLVLDRRWPEAARRELIARAYPLMRRRGTLGALTELLGIYLGRAPVLVEQWRIRGGAGAILGRRDGNARAILGAGLRVGGDVRPRPQGGVPDGFAVSAHRFCVLVPLELTAEQRGVVHAVVDRHKPAHTTYEICEVGSGMRVGRRLHVALTSVVGPGGGPERVVAGSTVLGDGVVGDPSVGSRLGQTTRAGTVRVG